MKIELWPHGDAEQSEPLGIVAIRNTGHASVADTDCFEYEVEGQDFTTPSKRRAGKVRHWRRRGWRTLVKRAVEEVL